MINHTDKNVTLDQLLLDPNNYRLIDEKEGNTIADSEAENLQGETIKRLDKQRLGELKDSMRNHGFLEMERIVIRLLKTESNGKEEEVNKKYIVVEGNRRVAALKSLQELNKKDPKALDDELVKKFNSINTIFIDGKELELKIYSATLMGIRHVSGPKKWDGFQSAKLINDLYVDGHSFTKIGAILGITSREVGRRFRGYQAFTQMRDNAEFKGKVEPRHYGLLLEFLAASKQGRDWLEWNDTLFKFEHSKNLSRVYKAIASDESEDLEIKNPTDARKFVSLLGNLDSRDKIEKGVRLCEMPDSMEYQKVGGKVKKINSFIEFIKNNSFSPEENERLQELLACLNSKEGVVY